jgi:hypothetical protein
MSAMSSTLRMILSAASVLALASIGIGCTPRVHLGPNTAKAYRSIFRTQAEPAEDASRAVAGLGQEEARSIQKGYVQTFAKGASSGASAGTSTDSAFLPAPATSSSGSDKQIVLSGD